MLCLNVRDTRFIIFMFNKVLIIALLSLTSACSSWVYRLDIPQGNYLDKKSIEQLQLGMTKEQVKFVLGSPVVIDSFEDDTWYYVYQFNSGRSEKLNVRKNFMVAFKDDELIEATGDFELPESFYTPIVN
jgi:outer membrane protein assembly factor BamE